jgi:hypothetical protein
MKQEGSVSPPPAPRVPSSPSSALIKKGRPPAKKIREGAGRSLLSQLFACNLITSAMYEAGLYYENIHKRYLKTIQAPKVSITRAFDPDVLFKGKGSPYVCFVDETDSSYTQSIEHKAKALANSLSKGGMAAPQMIHILESIIFENEFLPHLSSAHQLAHLRCGLKIIAKRIRYL